MDRIYVLKEIADGDMPGDEEVFYFKSRQGAITYLREQGYQIDDESHELFQAVKNVISLLDGSNRAYKVKYRAFLSKEKVLP